MTSNTPGLPHSPERPPTLMQRFHRLGSRARFLTVSLMVHAIIVVLGGGVVIVQHIKEANDFEAAGGTLMAEAEPQTQTPVDNSTELQSTEPAVAPTVVVSPVNAITSNVSQASFSLPSSGVPTGKVGGSSAADFAKGLSKGLGSATGKAGGTYLGTLDRMPNALVGTFYDLKQDRHKKPTGVSTDEYHRIFREFVKEGWRESLLSKYFRSPNRLYATQVFTPNMSADEGPKSFGVDKEVQPSRWLVHYQGRVSPPADGTYHFVGGGDDVLVVRFNGKVVLDRCWFQNASDWTPERNYNYGFSSIPNGFARGDAIKVRAGEFYDIEILIGEQPGGKVFFSLLMEQEGAAYQHDAHGNPILPIFRLADEPLVEVEKGQAFPPYAPNGPVWRAASVQRSGSSSFDDFFGRR